MRTIVFAAALILSVGSACADTIAARQAQEHAGQTVTVEGILTDVHAARSGARFLDIEGAYPNNAFAAVIFKADAGKFSDVELLRGKTVEVTGSIQLYNGRPEIILNDPGQLKAK